METDSTTSQESEIQALNKALDRLDKIRLKDLVLHFAKEDEFLSKCLTYLKEQKEKAKKAAAPVKKIFAPPKKIATKQLAPPSREPQVRHSIGGPATIPKIETAKRIIMSVQGTLEPPVAMVVPKTWDQLLDTMATKSKSGFAVNRVYTEDGRQLQNIDEIHSGMKVVGVIGTQKFIGPDKSHRFSLLFKPAPIQKVDLITKPDTEPTPSPKKPPLPAFATKPRASLPGNGEKTPEKLTPPTKPAKREPVQKAPAATSPRRAENSSPRRAEKAEAPPKRPSLAPKVIDLSIKKAAPPAKKPAIPTRSAPTKIGAPAKKSAPAKAPNGTAKAPARSTSAATASPVEPSPQESPREEQKEETKAEYTSGSSSESESEKEEAAPSQDLSTHRKEVSDHHEKEVSDSSDSEEIINGEISVIPPQEESKTATEPQRPPSPIRDNFVNGHNNHDENHRDVQEAAASEQPKVVAGPQIAEAPKVTEVAEEPKIIPEESKKVLEEPTIAPEEPKRVAEEPAHIVEEPKTPELVVEEQQKSPATIAEEPKRVAEEPAQVAEEPKVPEFVAEEPRKFAEEPVKEVQDEPKLIPEEPKKIPEEPKKEAPLDTSTAPPNNLPKPEITSSSDLSATSSTPRTLTSSASTPSSSNISAASNTPRTLTSSASTPSSASSLSTPAKPDMQKTIEERIAERVRLMKQQATPQQTK